MARHLLLVQVSHQLRSLAHQRAITCRRVIVILLLTLHAFYQRLASHLIPDCQPLMQLGSFLQAIACGK